MAPKSPLPKISPKPIVERYKKVNGLKDGSQTEGWKNAEAVAVEAQEEYKNMRREKDKEDPELRKLGAKRHICKNSAAAHSCRRREVNNKRSAHGTRVREIVFLKALGHEVDKAHRKREATLKLIAELKEIVLIKSREVAVIQRIVQRRDVQLRDIEAKREKDLVLQRPLSLETETDSDDDDGKQGGEALDLVKAETVEDEHVKQEEDVKDEEDDDHDNDDVKQKKEEVDVDDVKREEVEDKDAKVKNEELVKVEVAVGKVEKVNDDKVKQEAASDDASTEGNVEEEEEDDDGASTQGDEDAQMQGDDDDGITTPLDAPPDQLLSDSHMEESDVNVHAMPSSQDSMRELMSDTEIDKVVDSWFV